MASIVTEGYQFPISRSEEEAAQVMLNLVQHFQQTLFSATHLSSQTPWFSAFVSTFKYPYTGLPPHVMLYSFIKNIETHVKSIPAQMEDLLDKRQMAVPHSLEKVMEAVEKSAVMVKISNDLASLRRQNNSLAVSAAARQTNATTPCTYNVMAQLQRDYQHPDRVYR